MTLVGVNDLATTHPRIAGELHPKNGYAKTAAQLNAADPKTRDWLCPKDHAYCASVKQRVRGKSRPECKKQHTRTSGRSVVGTHPTSSRAGCRNATKDASPRTTTATDRAEHPEPESVGRVHGMPWHERPGNAVSLTA